MARKRMIDPEFFLDEQLAKLSAHARLLYIGSWALADDRAFTLPCRPDWIKAQVFPYEKVRIQVYIDELVSAGKFVEFESDGDKYLFIKNMAKYQRIERPSKQRYPSYYKEGSVSTHRLFGEDSVNTHAEVKRSEVKLREVEVKRSKEKGMQGEEKQTSIPFLHEKGESQNQDTALTPEEQELLSKGQTELLIKRRELGIA